MLLLDSKNHGVIAVNTRLRDRLDAHLHADRLERELADGASPEASLGLALRAQALTTTRSRRALAVGLTRVLAEASAPTVASMMRVPLNRAGVLAAAEELDQLRARLLAGGPLAAAGIARTKILLTVGNGPLRGVRAREDVRTAARHAIQGLDVLDHAWA